MRVAGGRLRQERLRHTEKRTHLVTPRALGDIVEQRAGCVGDIAHVRAALCETPHQKRLDRSKREFASLRAWAQRRIVIQYPCNLGRGKIRVEQKARDRLNARLVPRIAQSRTDF